MQVDQLTDEIDGHKSVVIDPSIVSRLLVDRGVRVFWDDPVLRSSLFPINILESAKAGLQAS